MNHVQREQKEKNEHAVYYIFRALKRMHPINARHALREVMQTLYDETLSIFMSDDLPC